MSDRPGADEIAALSSTGDAARRARRGRSWWPTPRITALVVGGIVLVVLAADFPLAALAHQRLDASGGSVPVWISGGCAAVGFLIAYRMPRNPIGWLILGIGAFLAISEDASFFLIVDYRLSHGTLPLGWVALLAQPGWAPAIVLIGIVMLLFPDGRPPSPRWRWLLWLFAATAALWIGGALTLTVQVIAAHRVAIDTFGNLAVLSRPGGRQAWWDEAETVFFILLAACWVASVVSQVLSYRTSAGERRQQLKWLLSGTVIEGAAIAVVATSSGAGVPRWLADVVGVGLLALPVTVGVAIMRYRLFDIDRLISRTLAYAIVTGLLVGVYAGTVLLATSVVSVGGTVAVAVSTLVAAALFNPVRRRVQRLVDRRFNRTRYDADLAIAAFAAKLNDAVDLDAVGTELIDAVRRSLEPTSVALWIGPFDD